MKPTPKTKDIFNQLEWDLKNQLGVNQNEDLKENLVVLASVMAAKLKMVYMFLSDIQKNALPDKADSFANGGDLERHGLIHLGRLPFAATDGKYKISVNAFPNSLIKKNTTLKSDENSKSPGKMYIVDSNYTADGVDDYLEIRSLESGLESLLNVGDKLSFSEPIIGVDFEAEIVDILDYPTSAQTEDDYRKSILESIQIEPYGGSKGDYIIWGKDAEGVKNIFPYVKEDEPGIVQIYVEATSENSLDGLGTPSRSMIEDVEQVIFMDPDTTKEMFLRTRKPIQVELEVLPINLRPVDIEILNLQNVDTSISNKLKQNLKDVILDIRPFVYGASLERDRNDLIYLGIIQNTIIQTLTANNYFNSIKLLVDGVAVDSFQFSRANIPYLRNLKINGSNV